MANCCVCGKHLGLLTGSVQVVDAAGVETDKKACYSCWEKVRNSRQRFVYNKATGTVTTEPIPVARKEKQDIYNFIKENKTYSPAAADPGIDAIVDLLHADETIAYAFGAIKVERNNASTMGICTIVMTNERLIISGDVGAIKLDFTANSYDVSLISSVSVSSVGYENADIVIEMVGNDDIRIRMSRSIAIGVNQELEKCINAVKAANKVKEAPAVMQQLSAADEIRKFKELLDAGIITQEEFDAKKKQLLGL